MKNYFIYSNYYYNFGFNITSIINERNEFNKAHRDLIKSPGYEWIPFLKERQSIDQLHAYEWDKAVGLGTILGFNKLRALDVDECEDFSIIEGFLEGLGLPQDYSWVIKSGSHKGFHIIFYADDHGFKVAKDKLKVFGPKSKYRKSFKHIELRWKGHLVLPPSIHNSFLNYEFLKDSIPNSPPSHVQLNHLYRFLYAYCDGKSLVRLKSDTYSGMYLDTSIDYEFECESKLHMYDNNTGEITIEYLDELEYTLGYKHLNETYLGLNEDRLEKPFYLFLDTETTGVPTDWNAPISDLDNWPRIVQIAWLLYDSKANLIAKCVRIVRPDGFSIPIDSTDVHGISNEYAINNGIGIDTVLMEFEQLCKKSQYLVAHNIKFDSRVIGAEFLRNFSRNPVSELDYLCTMESTTEFCKIPGSLGYKWPKLSELYDVLFGKKIENAHDALVDVEVTAKCFWKLKELDLI